MRFRTFVAFAGLALCLAAPQVKAQTITNLYGTGVSVTGTTDTKWTVTGPSTATASATTLDSSQFPVTPYYGAPLAGTKYIAPAQYGAGTAPAGNFTYETTFTSSSKNGSLAGYFSVDNYLLSIVLNGVTVATSFSPNAFGGGATPFSFTASDFLVGTNTLDFIVQNYAGSGGNPTALDVAFVPEPSAYVAMILGGLLLGGLLLMRRRSARSAC